MNVIEFFRIIQEDIHSTVIATADKNNMPVTCVIDIMDYDEDGLYFLTARGKNFYNRLKEKEYLSFTGIKGNDTMHSVSVTICGNVREIGKQRLKILLKKIRICRKFIPMKNQEKH